MASIGTGGQAATRGLAARLKALAALSLLFVASGCAIIPRTAERPEAPPPVTEPTERVHQVALLAPLSGPNADIGNSIANAATMGFIDTRAENVRLTTYDTAGGARAAAQQALADGNRLFLGPLLSDNVAAVAAVARPANVPVIGFSNDAGAAAPGVFLMAQMPAQSVERVVRYAHEQGKRRFAALVPTNVYGERAAGAFTQTVKSLGATLVGVERYNRSSDSVRAAAARLEQRGAYDALLIADNGRAAMLVAPIARSNGAGIATFLGTELWNTESELVTTPSLRGALFASVADRLYGDFAQRYRTQYGTTPFRLSTMGYDAALLTVSLADDWTARGAFPTGELMKPGGFQGVDGPFRFARDGVVERMLEVQRVDSDGFTVVDPAPGAFND